MSMQKEDSLGGIAVPEATKRLEAFRFDYPNRLWFYLKNYTDATCEAEFGAPVEGDLTEEEKEQVLDDLRASIYKVLAAREEYADATEV